MIDRFRPAAPHPGLKVIIVGPPRSGTSFLTGLVHRMGYRLGPDEWLKAGDEHNPYGYFECEPLKAISYRILQKLGGDFHHLPAFEPGWTARLDQEKREIQKWVREGNIELYKDNRVLVLADLYDELFPAAKWIFINRDLRETYTSRFGDETTFEEWERLTAQRLALWQASRPAAGALTLDYRDFKADLEASIDTIQQFLGIRLTEAQRQACLEFFKPRR